MTFPTFRELAQDLVQHHPPHDELMGEQLDGIRAAFHVLCDELDDLGIPEGPDATIAARKLHDACQACIFAVVHQPSEPAAEDGGNS